jgi:hypothetical protein
VDGVITANILCEDSETNANSVQPTEIFLTNRNFDRFSGDIILYKCSTLTTFEMSDGSAYNLTGKIEITQNDALESVYIYQLYINWKKSSGFFICPRIRCWSESICRVFWG